MSCIMCLFFHLSVLLSKMSLEWNDTILTKREQIDLRVWGVWWGPWLPGCALPTPVRALPWFI